MVFISYVPSAQEASRLVREQKKNLMTAKDEFVLVFIKYQNGVIFLNHSTESNKTETVIPYFNENHAYKSTVYVIK